MKRTMFLNQASELGLQRVASSIADAAKECIHIKSEPADNQSFQVGKSKIGGDPDLPRDIEWPSWEDTRLAFLLQVNLSEVAGILPVRGLPKCGLLSFFYHPDQATWGFDPKDRGSWRTCYFPDISKLERISTPILSKYMDSPYKACSITHKADTSFPCPFSEFIQGQELSDAEYDTYWELYHSTLSSHPAHQLFGHPNIVQNPMEIECEMVTNGVYFGDRKWLKHPRLGEFKERSKDWCLLLQVDTDDDAGMMWGDAGMLYFWTRKESLLEKSFSDTWMVLQCY